MKFEFVAFYPDFTVNSPLIGTAHVYVFSEKDPDMNFDLKGIGVQRNKQGMVRVSFPARSQYDPETKKIVRFPAITFQNRDHKEQLIKLVKNEYLKWKKANPKIDKNVDINNLPKQEFHELDRMPKLGKNDQKKQVFHKYEKQENPDIQEYYSKKKDDFEKQGKKQNYTSLFSRK